MTFLSLLPAADPRNSYTEAPCIVGSPIVSIRILPSQTKYMAAHQLPHLFFLIIVCCSSTLLKGNQDLIEAACKTTEFHDLCVTSLKSHPSSEQADVKGLAIIMVDVGIANATATYSYLSAQLLSINKLPNGGDTSLKKLVLKLCQDKYANANASLRMAIADLSMDNYDYAAMHVTAAADYPDACHNMFRRYRGLVYPVKLDRGEIGLRSICTVVLDIMNLVPIN